MWAVRALVCHDFLCTSAIAIATLCHYVFLMGCFRFSSLPAGEKLIKSLNCLRINCVLIVLIRSLIFFLVSMMLNRYEPTEYGQLLATPEFLACNELFIRAGWHSFLTNLQGHDDAVSLQFALGFDGHTDKVGSMVFQLMEESIAQATGLPHTGDRWFKNFRLLSKDYDYVFKPEFLAVKGEKGFSKLWIREEFLNSLVIITKLITCEGRFSTFKAYHF